jgi:hypothetical protein
MAKKPIKPTKKGAVDRILQSSWGDPTPSKLEHPVSAVDALFSACRLGVHYGKRLPEIEATILRLLRDLKAKAGGKFYNDSMVPELIRYCAHCVGGRWPEIEPYVLAVGGTDAMEYWVRFGKGHWPAFDKKLLRLVKQDLMWTLWDDGSNKVWQYYDKVGDFWPEFYGLVKQEPESLRIFMARWKKKFAKKWKSNPGAEADFLATACMYDPNFLELYYAKPTKEEAVEWGPED